MSNTLAGTTSDLPAFLADLATARAQAQAEQLAREEAERAAKVKLDESTAASDAASDAYEKLSKALLGRGPLPTRPEAYQDALAEHLPAIERVRVSYGDDATCPLADARRWADGLLEIVACVRCDLEPQGACQSGGLQVGTRVAGFYPPPFDRLVVRIFDEWKRATGSTYLKWLPAIAEWAAECWRDPSRFGSVPAEAQGMVALCLCALARYYAGEGSLLPPGAPEADPDTAPCEVVAEQVQPAVPVEGGPTVEHSNGDQGAQVSLPVAAGTAVGGQVNQADSSSAGTSANGPQLGNIFRWNGQNYPIDSGSLAFNLLRALWDKQVVSFDDLHGDGRPWEDKPLDQTIITAVSRLNLALLPTSYPYKFKTKNRCVRRVGR